MKRRNERVEGFALNPLGSVDFAWVFASLGYVTKPAQDFRFTRRNINFAGACAAGAKNRLPDELRELLGDTLPNDAGMVRISSDPSGLRSQSQRPYKDRYLDVPAACLTEWRDDAESVSTNRILEAPLAVLTNHQYSASGSGVVSSRSAKHVGFNGLAFRP